MARRSRNKRNRPLTSGTVIGALSLVLPTLSLAQVTIRTGSLIPLAYTCVLSIAAFLLHGYDKMQARNLEWRVKETTLHSVALLGGWPGALVGIHYFQHKTRKPRFLVPFWCMVGAWHVVAWLTWS